MSLSSLGQVALQISNADASQEFYGQKLGLKQLFRYGELVFFDCDGVRLMLDGTSKVAIPPGSQCLYFKISDIDAVYGKLRNAGVAFVDRPHLVSKMPDHDLWMVFFKDPDGHLLALMEEKR
ncbi:VOC family protein [Undibacterium sp.]|jgi:methylmalonyl-CoA/ethylmalonyl-CoA epimerase|uniref:VOC family protein n=1 Tax=Undibacterium sp. TaxID=1914977 RepID=UPI002B97C48A|nr:VOC family protein [Undibacterium sp.]HTD04129.1 VOC family protein [Undibacterium sp.]